HWIIARGSTMRTDAVYTPSDCFETFPFPKSMKFDSDSFFELRHDLMLQNGLGLTKILGRLNDPIEKCPAILRLRGFYSGLDRAVADAYGWTDLKLDHDFHPTKQGIRFTISEDARREILDRLLALNHERYAEEVRQGLHEPRMGKKKASKRRTKKKATVPASP